MEDSKKHFENGLFAYNIVDYHRYLVALYSNHPNLIPQIAPESVGQFSLDNVNAIQTNPCVLVNSNVQSNFNQLNAASVPTNLTQYMPPPNRSVKSVNLQMSPLLNQPTNNYLTQHPVNLPVVQTVDRNAKLKSKCSRCGLCNEEDKIDSSNETDKNVTTAYLGTSTNTGSTKSNLSSNLSALRIQSSNGTRGSCSYDKSSTVLAKKTQIVTPFSKQTKGEGKISSQCPRAITKVNNLTINELKDEPKELDSAVEEACSPKNIYKQLRSTKKGKISKIRIVKFLEFT